MTRVTLALAVVGALGFIMSASPAEAAPHGSASATTHLVAHHGGYHGYHGHRAHIRHGGHYGFRYPHYGPRVYYGYPYSTYRYGYPRYGYGYYHPRVHVHYGYYGGCY
jgi:hypothetical protein